LARKVIYWAVGASFCMAVLAAVFSGGGANTAAVDVEKQTAPPAAAIESAKRSLATEKQIESVSYDPDQIAQWQIMMVNDGSSRVGYANYICGVLQENGAVVAGTKVKIVDAANLLVPAKDRNQRGMGTVACEDFAVIDGGDMSPIVRR